MKRLLTIIILLTTSDFLYPQKITAIFRDLVTNVKDTIFFGIDNNATIGIDSLLGEKDIKSKPFDSLDIRIIQRDSTNFYCLIPFGIKEVKEGKIIYDSIYYSPSFDSKVNYRPKDSSYRHFELFLNYYHSIRFNFISSSNIKFQSFLDKITQYNRKCPQSIPILYDSLFVGGDDIYEFISGAQEVGTHLIFSFKAEYSVSTITENEKSNLRIEIYPNPFSNVFSITTVGELDLIEVVDLNGRSYLREMDFNGINLLNIHSEEWPSGIYILRGINKKNNLILVKKLIKA
jgi:hypothetical protein